MAYTNWTIAGFAAATGAAAVWLAISVIGEKCPSPSVVPQNVTDNNLSLPQSHSSPRPQNALEYKEANAPQATATRSTLPQRANQAAPNRSELQNDQRTTVSASPVSGSAASSTASGQKFAAASLESTPSVAEGTNTGNNSQSNTTTAGGSEKSTASTQQEIQIPVPRGEVVPVAFLDITLRPAPQQRALDLIVREFNQNVTTPDGAPPSPEVWRNAKEIADSRYIKLYGFRKYNEMSLTGSKQALKEKQATSASGAQP